MIISKIIEDYDVYIDTKHKRVLVKEMNVNDFLILAKAFKHTGYNIVVG
jgi:hypothetical protein